MVLMSASLTDDVELPIESRLNILSKSDARFFVSAISHLERRLNEALLMELFRRVTFGVDTECSGEVVVELLESLLPMSNFLTSFGLFDVVAVVLSVHVAESSV